jgi:hypothetical protein
LQDLGEGRRAGEEFGADAVELPQEGVEGVGQR